ncbi:MAG: 2OG-Fe(II) oxygenase [Synechococcales cyanobacterium CRU_2_2]|nr:2OG-Fe(II) oxygenase [Synechococcales cyanobacterium CRU_2_2]
MSKLLHPQASEYRVFSSSSGQLETGDRQSISRHLPGHGGKSRVLSALNRLESHRWRRWLYRLQAKLRGIPTPLSCARLPGVDQQIVRSLRQQGGFQTSLKALDLPMNPQFLQAAHRLAARLPNPQEAKASSATDHLGHCIHGDAAQIVRDYPEVLLWGLEERLLDLVEAYVQLPVSYLGVNLRKDIPNGQQVGTRLWHLDGEDTCVVKILVYLSDVEQEHGPFEYVPKSQFNSAYRYLSPKYWRHQTLYCHDENMEKIVGRDRWHSATGAAGSVIFADTTQIFHHGAVPTQERVALIFAYATRMPKKLDFCKQFFPAESLLPSLRPRLSARQWDCVWGWRRMAELTDS